MNDYILASNGELLHYGVKGMKWGVRREEKKALRKEIDRERSKLRNKYDKEYGVSEAYDKADKDYNDAYAKLGYDPDDGERYYARAEKLSSKSAKAVDRDMRARYGKEYDDFLKAEQRFGEAMIVGGVVLSAAFMYGSYKALQLGGRAMIGLGKAAVRKILS